MFAPYKDRTISLILESDYTARGKAGFVKNTAQDLGRRYLPAQGRSIGGKTLGDAASNFIDLKGPSSITMDHATGVAQEQGLFTTFLQPWYVKGVTLTIKGTSYLGAYPLLSNPDKDAERLLRLMYQTLNDFSGRLGTAGNKQRTVLIIRGAPKQAQKFVGYITNLNLTESVDNAYLMDYTLSFVGKRMDNVAQSNGTAAGKASGVGA